ncbi:MAG: hypothetical protein ABIP39_06475 [Polyangiaceae bacterium]
MGGTRRLGPIALTLFFAGCGSSAAPTETPFSSDRDASGAGTDGGTSMADLDATLSSDAADASDALAPTCTTVNDLVPTVIGTASTADEYALHLDAVSASRTSWAEKDNEAVVLEVLRGATLVGHLVLHQGQDGATYSMHLGALAAGDVLSVRVSPLTAKNATREACVGSVVLAASATLGAAAEGLVHAPIVKWPLEKTFDDLPIVLGWTKNSKGYQLLYTNENGGTVALCGGSATGMRSEIARWGRGYDMEGVYGYGAPGHFERCDGTVPPAVDAPRMHALHPVLYYGDGHNRLFESRGGYATTCGTGSDKNPDGVFKGWDTANPGNEEAKDDAFTVVLRPLPVDMDALGYAANSGRREGVIDHYAPWLYRLTDSELAREGKIDGVNTFAMDRYLFVDVYAADVGGSGDNTCGGAANGGFVLRVNSGGGVVNNGPEMTADYFGGATDVKRIAIPLDRVHAASDITGFVFDAYDNDGIYLLGIGDAFIPRAKGTNGATLDRVRTGRKDLNVYVDDDSSGCVAGMSLHNGVNYPCAGTLYSFTP